MKTLLLACGAAALCVAQASAGAVPVTLPPYQVSATIGSATLSDGQVLPAFTISFEFLQSLTSGQSFFNGSAITNISVPVLVATGGLGPSVAGAEEPATIPIGKTDWVFDEKDSFFTAEGAASVLSLEFDPANFDVIFTLDPSLTAIPEIVTPPVTVSDNIGGPNPDANVGSTVDVTPAPEPGSLILVGGAMLLLGVKLKNRLA